MPCRDDDYYSNYAEASKRADTLAVELCQVRQFVHQWTRHLVELSAASAEGESSRFQGLSKEVLPDHLLGSLRQILEKHHEHRGHDKTRALTEAVKKRDGVSNKIKQIQDLGGVPGEKILNELKSLKTMIREIEDSDPMETELY